MREKHYKEIESYIENAEIEEEEGYQEEIDNLKRKRKKIDL